MNDTKEEKLVSVIMPVYNEEPFLADAVDSVLNQTYKNIELLLIDDCSEDRSFQILEKYREQDSRVRVFQNRIHRGVSETRNLGITHSQGDFIAFLDADDLWTDRKLSHQIAFMTENQIHFSCTSYKNLKQGRISRISVVPPRCFGFGTLLAFNFVGCLTVIYSVSEFGRREFKDVGHPDYLLWLDMLRDTGIKARSLREPLALYRVGHKSLSSNKMTAGLWQWHIYKREFHFSMLKSGLLMVPYFLIGIYKKVI